MGSVKTARLPREKDYIRTDDGLYFCVFSYRHPPDGYAAYLQYLPTAGHPRRDRIKPMDFPHVGAVARTMGFLADKYPHYVRPGREHPLPVVPAERVAVYYCPEQRLCELLAGPRDELERLIAQMARDLADAAGIPITSLGVTGSVLLDVHHPPTSDIDLVVYGAPAARRVREALRAGRVPGARPMLPEWLRTWQNHILRHLGLSPEAAAYFIRRAWYRGWYGGREFSIRPVRTDAEIQAGGDGCPAEGDWRPAGPMRVRARVAGAAEAMFVPACYPLEHVQVLEGMPLRPARLVAYEGIYADALDPGQEVEAMGKLEVRADGDRRLVVGTLEYRGREYIRPVAGLAGGERGGALGEQL